MTDYSKLSFPDTTKRIIRVQTSNIGAITAAIPEAQPVEYRPTGEVLVDLPFEFEVMEALSVIGEPSISTIINDYDFNGRNPPFQHQKRIAEFLTRNPRAYCFAGMGTGKTRSVLWAADYLMELGKVKKMLVVCPKSLMYSAWADDIFATCLHRTHTVLYGDRKQREKLVQRDTEIDIINFDGVEILEEQLKHKDYDLVVLDESTAYKDPSTRRWKSLNRIIKPETRIWALTGTPTPQGAMDAYGQAKMVTPHTAPRTKTVFQSMTQYKVATFIWRDRPDWRDTVNQILQPAIYVRKEDCLDLPPMMHTFRETELSAAQKAAIACLKTDMLVHFTEDRKVAAANAAVLHGKLRQVYAGAVYADDGTALALDNKVRIAETIELIKRARAEGDDTLADGKPHSKALVFIPFKHTMTVLEAELSKHFNIAVINGDTTVNERKRILKQFQTTAQPEVILAIPEAFSHGVTATAASLTVWYAPPSRTETYLQACERTARPGQTQKQTVVHLFGDKTERRMYDNLINNKQNQDDLLGMYYDFVGAKK